MQFTVRNRWTDEVQFVAEIECSAGTDLDKTGLAAMWAVRTGADLTDANLTDAYLRGADLTDANLTGADLTGADLTGAYLTDANLTGADLTDANLTDANLRGADLTGANLTDAYLRGADLTGANLTDALWHDIAITGEMIQVSGLLWPVTIVGEHMKIGCELHRLDEWSVFDDHRIAAMDGREAIKFWRRHKASLLALALASHTNT